MSDRRISTVGAEVEYEITENPRLVTTVGGGVEYLDQVNPRLVSEFGIGTEYLAQINYRRISALGICVEYRPGERRRRISGKRALIQLQRGTDARFDVSGLNADGEGRANKFSFVVEPAAMIQVAGHQDAWKEERPAGESAWSADLVVFYAAEGGEANEYLHQMFSEQHGPAACADPTVYTLYIMPEAACDRHEIWTGYRAVIRSLNVKIAAGALMLVTVKFSGWKMVRTKLVV